MAPTEDEDPVVLWGSLAVLIAIVWVYRVTLSWLLGGQCRFQPTCSQYMLDAVEKYGPWRGGYKGIRRILRCHPLGGSGIDNVPD